MPFVFPPGSGDLAVLLIAVFLQPVKDVQQKNEEKRPSFWFTVLSTFRLLKDRRLCLLVLLPMYSGFEQAFLAGDYTRVRGMSGMGNRGPPASARHRALPWAGGGQAVHGLPGPSWPGPTTVRVLGLVWPHLWSGDELT